MQSREIPHDQWHDFLHDFSQQHEGWLVTVEVLDPSLGDQIVARDWPLQGISYDPRHHGPGEGNIAVVAGDDASLTHMVTSPTAVWLAESEEGVDKGLELESGDGPRTLVTFRSPMQPNMLDGA